MKQVININTLHIISNSENPQVSSKIFKHVKRFSSTNHQPFNMQVLSILDNHRMDFVTLFSIGTVIRSTSTRRVVSHVLCIQHYFLCPQVFAPTARSGSFCTGSGRDRLVVSECLPGFYQSLSTTGVPVVKNRNQRPPSAYRKTNSVLWPRCLATARCWRSERRPDRVFSCSSS